MAYAKSVRPSRLHSAVLPDPAKLFDGCPFPDPFANNSPALSNRIQAASEPIQQSFLLHDDSSFTWCFPLIVTQLNLDLFHTSRDDITINMASSYLDLSPLYGSSQAEQNLIRTFQNGKIKSDSYSDRRLELFPPGVAALMICFNRFHNYVAQQLALINEGGRFDVPAVRETKVGRMDDEMEAEAQRDYISTSKTVDNELFNTARL